MSDIVSAQVNLPERTAAAIGRPSLELRGSLSDQSVFRMMRASGEYEPHLMNALVARLPVGGVFVDVGANLGIHTLVGAMRVGAQGKVLAIEASPITHQLLQENVALHGCQNVTAWNRGAWHESADLVFTHITTGPGWSFISSTGASAENCQEINVACEPLDDLIQRANLGRVNLIKVDVEGAEINVLQGATGTIARDRPDIILEVNPTTMTMYQGFTVDELVGLLDRFGYSISVLAPDSATIPIGTSADLKRIFDAGEMYIDVLCQHP
jgi:FkbM family methyltransferase